MGAFGDRLVAEIGEHVVEVEARSTMFGFDYDLIIDGARADRRKGLVGDLALHGTLSDAPVTVTIRQRLLGTKYTLEVAGQEQKMRKLY